MANADIYLDAIRPLLGRALSGLDAEPTSQTRGSFDRTWWCWKFTDFSATRFQEGAHLLAWLAVSPNSPAPERARDRFADMSLSALAYWTRLQHRDGSFDEAYPFERSLAATAFTGFYLGCAVEKLRLRPGVGIDAGVLGALERGAHWLAGNGEYHGVLSNHLAAAAGALQLAGDVLGIDRFNSARDRYLDIIYGISIHPKAGCGSMVGPIPATRAMACSIWPKSNGGRAVQSSSNGWRAPAISWAGSSIPTAR